MSFTKSLSLSLDLLPLSEELKLASQRLDEVTNHDWRREEGSWGRGGGGAGLVQLESMI